MLTTFSSLVREAREQIVATGADEAYADSVAIYLAFIISKLIDYNCSLVAWYPQEDRPSHVFTRQALSMVWDYVELNPFAAVGGTWDGSLEVIVGAMTGIPSHSNGKSHARQADATSRIDSQGLITCTDPPYYDNVGYADLADFFYIWLRRSLGSLLPGLMGTMLTPKHEELVADPFRHNSKAEAEQFFEGGFTKVFHSICEHTPTQYPIAVFYAFKQSEKDDTGQHASTGWETLLEGMLNSGWAVTATWPMHTERRGRTRDIGSNALASSIVLACRPRPADAGFTDRRGLINALREEFPNALRKLEQGKVAPVDLRQAAIGPGMAIFSRYARVNEPDGTPMRVRAALSLINQVLDEKLSQLEGSVSPDTRFCVEWFKQYGFEQGPFGTAETLSKGTDTGIDGLVRAGVVKSAAGKVKLLSVRDIPDFYDPEADDRTSEWEICLHLVKALQERGADEAARLMASARRVPAVDLDDVKELAYLLYSIAEKKGWAETALLFNNLGTSWTDLEKLAQTAGAGTGGQGEFTLEFGSDDDGDE
jgi:putative DNA methylase